MSYDEFIALGTLTGHELHIAAMKHLIQRHIGNTDLSRDEKDHIDDLVAFVREYERSDDKAGVSRRLAGYFAGSIRRLPKLYPPNKEKPRWMQNIARSR